MSRLGLSSRTNADYGSTVEQERGAGLEWAIRFAARVGQRVAYFRERTRDDRGRKLTAQGLANRCNDDLGYPMNRTMIAKLEAGLRQSISVPELIVLAAALDVPPLLLALPVGDAEAETVEVLPGREVPPWTAAQWFTGEDQLDVLADAAGDDAAMTRALEAQRAGARPLILFRRHELHENAWINAMTAAYHYRQMANDENAADETRDTYRRRGEERERDARQAEMALRQDRDEMRAHGVSPPPLRPDLAHVDAINPDVLRIPPTEEGAP